MDTQLVDTPYGRYWKEWYSEHDFPIKLYRGVAYAARAMQWRRDETGQVWYCLYRAA